MNFQNNLTANRFQGAAPFSRVNPGSVSRHGVRFGSSEMPPTPPEAPSTAPAAEKSGVFKRTFNYFFKRTDDGKGEIGLLKFLRTLGRYIRVSENRKIITGFALQYGVPALTAASFAFGPIGWIVGGTMLAPSILLSNWGERMITRLEQEGKISKTSGPLARVASIKAHWAKALENKTKDLVEMVKANREYVKQILKDANQLIDDLLPDNETVPNISKVREKLHLKEDGRAAGFLTHALTVKLKYKERWSGWFLGILKKSLGRIPVIKWPVLGFTMLCQGLLMLVSHRAVKAATAQAAKKAV